jgi:hypothetical protein
MPPKSSLPSPPPVLDCARVIEYAVLNESIGYSGRTLLFVDRRELGQVPCLAICADKEPPGVLLFHCNSKWTVLGCSGHDSIAKAKARAEGIYPGLSACWVDAHVSEEQAERYLDDLFRGKRCSFCGKRPDQVERLIQKNKARICDHCINEFHDTLHKPSSK